MTEKRRSKCSTRRHEPEVTDYAGTWARMRGREAYSLELQWWVTVLYHSILETSGAVWDAMKAKDQSLCGLLFTPRPRASFLLYFPGSVTTHPVFSTLPT